VHTYFKTFAQPEPSQERFVFIHTSLSSKLKQALALWETIRLCSDWMISK